MSGSFVVAGSGRMRATKVGADAYAFKLSSEARRFTLVKSELRERHQPDHHVRRLPDDPDRDPADHRADPRRRGLRRRAVQGSVAGLVAMVPEGLVLLTSIAFAVGAQPAGPQAGAHPGARRHRGPGPGRRRLPRQDRHPHRRRAGARHRRAPRRATPGDCGDRPRSARRGRRPPQPQPARDQARVRQAPGLDRDRRRAVLVGPQVERRCVRRPRRLAARRARHPAHRGHAAPRTSTRHSSGCSTTPSGAGAC